MGVTLDGPVGLRWRRHNVTNRISDQEKVIRLLSAISGSNGGKEQAWGTPPRPGADGACPALLATAIWDFQVFWKGRGEFRNIDGVVDPGMNTLKKMNQLASGNIVASPVIRYNVAMVSQQWSAICWLACAAMILQFKRRHTPSASDLGIADSDDFRMPITMPGINQPEMRDRLRRLGFVVTRSSDITGFSNVSGPDVDLIVNILEAHGPFILCHHVGAFWYGANRGPVQPVGLHAVVVTGVELARQRVYFNNPWGDRDVPTTVTSIVGAIRRFEAAGFLPIAYLPN